MGTLFNRVFDLDSGTISMIIGICAVAVWIIRSHLSSAVMMVLIFPWSVLLSILANFVFVNNHMFVPTKFSDWLVWTTLAATAGNLMGVGSFAMLAQYMDRERQA
jgi:thiol:disulfide interchange protein